MPSMNIKDYVLAGAGIALLALALWGWRVDGLRARYKSERDQARTEYAIFRTAIQAKVANEVARQKEITRVSDIEHDKELADARSAADEYIRTHRVRLTAPIHSSAPAKAGNTAISQAMPARPDVVVSEADVRACTDAATYAMSAHNWAMNLGDK